MNMDVKKIMFSAIFGLLLVSGIGQVGVKNTLTLEAGVGGNAYKWQTSETFNSMVAASWDYNIMIGYNFHPRVNASLEFENHTYLTNEDSTQYGTDYLGAHRIGIGLRYALIDHPKYQLSLGGTVGGFNFGYNISDSSSTASVKAGGIYQTYGFTNKFLFGEKGAFGLFLKAGIVNNPMTISEVIVNGEQKDELDGRPIQDYKFVSLGYYLKFGLTYNFKGDRRVRANFE